MIVSPFTAHGLMLGLAWLAAGMAIGGFFFLTLRWSVQMLTAGRPLLPVITIQFARFAAVGVTLAAIAIYFGALPLLAATAGILAARLALVRWGT